MNYFHELSAGEQHVVQTLTLERMRVCAQSGLRSRKQSEGSDEGVWTKGFGGELAFCQIFNIYPDLTSDIRSAEKGTDRPDARLITGRAVDVKTTRWGGDLNITRWHKPVPDALFALMEEHYPKYQFVGFIDQVDALVPANLVDGPNGQYYRVKRENLLSYIDIGL